MPQSPGQSNRRRRLDQKLGYYARNADRINAAKREARRRLAAARSAANVARSAAPKNGLAAPHSSLDPRALARDFDDFLSKLPKKPLV